MSYNLLRCTTIYYDLLQQHYNNIIKELLMSIEYERQSPFSSHNIEL